MYTYLKNRPMLLSAVLGSALALFTFYCPNASVITGAAFIALFFIMVIKRAKPEIIFSIFCVVMIIINLQLTLQRADSADLLSGSTLNGSFCITENPVDHGDYESFTAEARDCAELKNGTKVFMFYGGDETLCMGDLIECDAKLKSVSKSDFKAGNYAENIYLSANIKNIAVKSGAQDKALFNLSRLQRGITNTLFENLSTDESATLNAIVTGDKSYISPEFESCVRGAGISHVLVVSGMHLSIIMTFIMGLLERFIYNRYAKPLIMFAVTVFLMALCGFTMSVVRSGVTYMLIAVSLLIGRTGERSNTLGAAVTLILLFSPFAILSISLQLSVLSTFGVLAVSPAVMNAVCERVNIKNSLAFSVLSLAVSSVCASLMTMPVVILVFGYVSVVAVISNIIIAPIVTVSLIAAFCGLVLSLISPVIAKPCFLVSGITAKYFNFMTEHIGGWKYSAVNVSRPFAVISVIVIFAVLQLLLYCRKRRDMLKLYGLNEKIKAEGGDRLIWR